MVERIPLTPLQNIVSLRGAYDALMDYPHIIQDEPGQIERGCSFAYDTDLLSVYVGGYRSMAIMVVDDPGQVIRVRGLLKSMGEQEALQFLLEFQRAQKEGKKS